MTSPGPTAPPATVRPLRTSDEPVWRTLWRGYLAFYETELRPEIYDASFERLCDPSFIDYNGLLAEVDGQGVGLAHYITHFHGWKLEPVCYLQDLYTHPEARGRGIGQALIEAVYRAADGAGAPSVYWLTQEFNHPARKLYDRVGQLTPFIKYQRP